MFTLYVLSVVASLLTVYYHIKLLPAGYTNLDKLTGIGTSFIPLGNILVIVILNVQILEFVGFNEWVRNKLQPFKDWLNK